MLVVQSVFKRSRKALEEENGASVHRPFVNVKGDFDREEKSNEKTLVRQTGVFPDPGEESVGIGGAPSSF